jgi:glutamate formiminotransferase
VVVEVAVRLIDLHHHTGVHPRMGAADVVPFVPLRGATLGDAAALARALAGRVGEELAVPAYLYGAAAAAGRPTELRAIRGRGWEAMVAAGDAVAPPDAGPRLPHATAGATAVGARLPLVAFNVLLNSDSLETARRLARQVRASSGGLPAVQAMGVVLASAGAAQVSMNLLDHATTNPARVLRELRRLAEVEGVEVVRAELVGLLPAAALAGIEDDGLAGLPGAGDTIEARLAAAGLDGALG